MTNLTNLSIESAYGDYLTTTNGGQGLTNTLNQLQDGFGNASTITIARNAINFNRQGGNTFRLDGVSIIALGSDINSVCSPNPIATGNGSLTVPVGTVAERPTIPSTGMIRFNEDIDQFEGYDGAVWGTLGGGGGGGGVTSVGISGSTGMTVTGSPITTSGVIDLTLSNELQAVSSLNTTGIISRTNTATYITRTFTTSNTNLTIIDGDGVAGPPIIGLSDTLIGLTSGEFDGVVINGDGIESTINSNNLYFDTNAGAIFLQSNTIMDSGVKLYFNNSSNTHYASFHFSGNNTVDWTLPPSDSTGTQFLTSNGSGIMGWASSVTSVVGTANRITSSGGFSPMIDISVSYIGQTSLTTLGTITTGTWNGTTLSVSYGGTGATSAPLALVSLGALPIAGGTMTGSLILSGNPTSSNEAATKSYVDGISNGLSIKKSCYAGTTSNLNATYSPGGSGIGATLTNNGAFSAFDTDGVSPPINSRVLIKNQTTSAQNGIYNLTIVGNGSTAWILTRSTDYNQPGEIGPGDFVIVDNGTTLISTAWIQTDTVITVGADPIVFSQFGNQGTVTSITAGSNLTGGTISTSGTIALSATPSGLTSIGVGNLSISGNTVISSNTNGNIVLAPNGLGANKFNNGQIVNRTTVNVTSYTALTSDYVIGVISTSPPVTITLPAASGSNLGQVYIVKDETGGANSNNITIQISGGGLIDGGASIVINQNYGSVSVYSSGSAWFVM